MAFEFNQIAAGHDNLEELERWSKLVDDTGCKLFQGYKKFIPMEWHCAEGQEMGGDRLYVKIGLPWFTFAFPLITEEEDNYLTTNYTINGISGPVTLTAYDRDALEWKNYNAIMHILPENKNFNVEMGFYDDYRIDFRDLEEI